MTRVTRRYRFVASHRLHSPQFSEGKNRELYGKCNNPFGHGHDYLLDVSVAGPIDGQSGQVVNLQLLDRLVSEQVLHDFDHRYLNVDVQEFKQATPTSENIILVIEKRLREQWSAVFPCEWPQLENIGLRETRRNRFDLKAN
jgi:6-pyruvoyltetrahydropterin/6-carboxytetrahydropterin synthase